MAAGPDGGPTARQAQGALSPGWSTVQLSAPQATSPSWGSYQYKTSSPHSTSNRKCEKATGMELFSQAMRYQARSSVISSRFSRSFQPHSLCSYLGDWGAVRTRDSGRAERPGAGTRPVGCTYMVCMLVLVRSKAQSTVAGSSPDTRLHSMETFNLGGEEEAGGAGCWPHAGSGRA